MTSIESLSPKVRLLAGFSKYAMFHEKDGNDSYDKPVSDNGP